MNTFNEDEFLDICSKLGAVPIIKEVTIEYLTNDYFNKVKKAVSEDRRGEVVFCVIRPNNKVVTVTCEEYPNGIFRIPTGGIGHDEDIVAAVYRETKEELGIDTEIVKFIGVIKIRFRHKEDFVMFYSYMFILKETGGKLLIDAIDDEVSEIKEVDAEGLESVVGMLGSIEGEWNDWGRFRQVTTGEILNCLKSYPDLLK